ncbi:MAG: hypothetical protein QOH06_4731 [Acidobacteriota bacterium]|jgi:hypothetical protein|nr:hypothetical protein [Acidobacteriota bacterium]
MPNIGNYAKVIQTFKKVLAATEEHAAKMPDVSQIREELQNTVGEAEEAKVRQESHTATRQATTQELKEIVDRGRDLVMLLQSAAKLGLGPRSEQLVQFGTAPLRGRSRRPAVEEPEPPPLPEAPAPESQSQGSEQ